MNNNMDDMDDLFRRAAEDYPLNTDSSDWNKVMQQLHDTSPVTPVTEKKRKKRDYLWLLLLLPIGFICGRYTDTKNMSSVQNYKIVKRNKGVQNVQHLTLTKELLAGKETKNTTAKKSAFQASCFFKNKKTFGNYQWTYSFENPINNFFAHQKQNTVSHSLVTKKTSGRSKKKAMGVNNEENGKGEVNGRESIALPQQNVTDLRRRDITLMNPTLLYSGQIFTTNQKSDSIIQQSFKVSNNSTRKINLFKKKLYAGIVVGPDFTSVKKQPIKRGGSTIGLFLSYRFSKKIAVETGVLWDTKLYYSEGEYFNTSKIALPYNVKIINVNGNCKMIELPVNVSYNFAHRKRGDWLVSAGISSYFMKKESYDYLYDHNSVQYSGYRSYKNSSENYLSIVNISAGYQYQIGKAAVRIAPYVKLPLKGVGIGSLPLSSTGLYMVLQGAVH